MIYSIYATAENTRNGWTSSIQIPTFYLNSKVQGIVNTEHARHIANNILNPLNNKDLKLNIHVEYTC